MDTNLDTHKVAYLFLTASIVVHHWFDCQFCHTLYSWYDYLKFVWFQNSLNIFGTLLKLILEFNQMSIFMLNLFIGCHQTILSYQGGNHNQSCLTKEKTTLSWKDNICCTASQAFAARTYFNTIRCLET